MRSGKMKIGKIKSGKILKMIKQVYNEYLLVLVDTNQ